MSQIKGKNTKPEILVRKFLFSQGFRFRLHSKKLPGKPDIVLTRYKTVVFIHGCFWHGHNGCRFFVIPKTRTEWWTKKIAANKSNDRTALRALEEAGWMVLEIFECELKGNNRELTLSKLIHDIKRGDTSN